MSDHAFNPLNGGWTCRYLDGSNAPEPVTVPHDARLEFEGLYQHADVMLDWGKLFFRLYVYTNFYVEMNGKLMPGEHQQAVIARKSDQPNHANRQQAA